MRTTVLFNDEARKKLLKGINEMGDLVSSTLGPKGQNVAYFKYDYHQQAFDYQVQHDGVSVANAHTPYDTGENLGASILRDAAKKTVDVVGDGTTVTILLGQSIVQECYKMIATGINPMGLRKGLEEGLNKLLNELSKHSRPIQTKEDKLRIATISAQNEELGHLVTKAFNKVGDDGVIQIVESKLPETILEYQEGMQFDRGYLHPLFITNPDKNLAQLDNTYILITDISISNLIDLQKLLIDVSKKSKKIVIIAPSIQPDAQALLIQNKLNNALVPICISAPEYGQTQKDILQDIALLTGAKFVTSDAAHKFTDLTIDDLGLVDYITCTKNDTVLISNHGSKKILKERIEGIKKQIDTEENEFDREKLRERLSKLTSGVAVIKAGGATEVEMKERKERIDDSVHALRAALKEGIVLGGEVTLLKIRKILSNSIPEQILYRALEKPFQKLISNAGENPGEKLALWGLQDDPDTGYDVMQNKFVNLYKEGIVDPTAVVKEALKNSISVAIQLFTIGGIILPDKREEAWIAKNRS